MRTRGLASLSKDACSTAGTRYKDASRAAARIDPSPPPANLGIAALLAKRRNRPAPLLRCESAAARLGYAGDRGAADCHRLQGL